MKRPAGRELPNDDRIIVPSGGNARPVPAEGNAINPAAMSGKGVEQAAGSRVPDLHGRVPARRSQPAAVGSEGQAAYLVLVARKPVDDPASSGFPDYHRRILPCRREST